MESEETSGRITLKTVVTAPFKLIALPFKIIFFVLVDGWYLVVGSLVRSFGG